MIKHVFSKKYTQLKESVPLEDLESKADKEHKKCFLRGIPLIILQVVENGSVEEFKRIVSCDVEKLRVCDSKGRTAIHYAALKNRVEILKIIFSYKEINFAVFDTDGNSPLHLAVKVEALDSISFLLRNGADPGILNNKSQSVLHLAAEYGKVESLKELAKHSQILDVNQPGDQGRTPLHWACIHNQFECVNILESCIDFEFYYCLLATMIEELHASPRRTCSHSFLPVHEAARRGSLEALENLLNGAIRDCSAEEMVNLPDNEGNLALHLAVQSGNLDTVGVCLKSGSKISTLQKNLSNAVHIACAQGSTEIVKLMLKAQPGEREKSLSSRDSEDLTPLHFAAMFDHTDLVEFLVDQDSPLNPLDKNSSTPLHLAASKNAWRSVKILIENGADVTAQDANGRTLLHTIVEFNGDLGNILNDKIALSLSPIAGKRDKNGNTALHIAAKNGQINSVTQLLTLGSKITSKNADGDTVFHVACRFSRIKIIQALSKLTQFYAVLNDSNNNAWTSLHIAAWEGHLRVIEFLLKKGAFLLKDHEGRTPLHLAAEKGRREVVSLLLTQYSHLINIADKHGNTPLHYAALNNQPKVTELLLRLNCQLTYNNDGYSAIDLALVNKFVEVTYIMVTQKHRGCDVLALNGGKHSCIMETLVAKMPAVAKAVFDKEIQKSTTEKPNSPSYHVEYNFKWLEKPDRCIGKSRGCGFLPILNDMVTHKRVSLLSHELSLKYLEMKWNAYGKFFQFANLFFYLIYLGLVTLLATNELQRDFHFFARWSWFNESRQQIPENCPTYLEQSFIDMSRFDYMKMEKMYKTFKEQTPSENMPKIRRVVSFSIAFSAIFNLVLEVVSIRRHGFKYCRNIDTWVWITMNISCFVATYFYLYGVLFPAPDGVVDWSWVNPSFALACFMGWFYLLLIMQRFEAVGLYVTMFLEILKTLFRVLIIFSILIIAFGLAFFVLLSNGNHDVFSNIPMSVIRTFSMMLGDLDFMNSFLYPNHCDEMERNNKTDTRGYTTNMRCTHPRRIPHPYATFPIVGLYMVFMPIVMINLLIGLAVGDIGQVRKNAQLKRLSMQVQIHTNIEKSLPKFILKKLNQSSVIEYPNTVKKSIAARFITFFQHKVKKEYENTMEIESDDLMEAILDNNVTLGQLNSDMENIKTCTQLICMALNVNSDVNEDDVTPTEKIH